LAKESEEEARENEEEVFVCMCVKDRIIAKSNKEYIF
jgi:hypothetical protein